MQMVRCYQRFKWTTHQRVRLQAPSFTMRSQWPRQFSTPWMAVRATSRTDTEAEADTGEVLLVVLLAGHLGALQKAATTN